MKRLLSWLLALLAALYGVPLEQCAAVGDSANDLTMLETTKVSVCMKNGDLAAKEVSDLICPSVEQDGLAAAFRELKLI